MFGSIRVTVVAWVESFFCLGQRWTKHSDQINLKFFYEFF